jgi:hypothetical protein
MNRYGEQGPRRFLSHALRHPVCDLALLNLIEQAWEEIRLSKAVSAAGVSLSSVARALLPMYSSAVQKLPCEPVPRRIFRLPPSDAPDDKPVQTDPLSPLARYMSQHYRPSGKVLSYGIRHAVYTGQTELARELITLGGYPFDKEGLALEIAMRRQDLQMVRVLVETRVGTLQAMITDEIKALILKFATREILDYFVKERKVKLSLGSILAL